MKKLYYFPCVCSGLQKHLNEQGFNIFGYGCTTCIGNSGELDESVASAISENGNTVNYVFITFSIRIYEKFIFVLCQDFSN